MHLFDKSDYPMGTVRKKNGTTINNNLLLYPKVVYWIWEVSSTEKKKKIKNIAKIEIS